MKVHELRQLAPRWRWLLPILSMQQLRTVLAVLAIAAVVLLLLFGDARSSDFQGVLLGVFVGMVPSLLATLPASFLVETRSDTACRAVLDELDRLLERRAYMRVGGHYEPKTSVLIHWAECHIRIECQPGDRLLVRGPWQDVGWLRRQLIASSNGTRRA